MIGADRIKYLRIALLIVAQYLSISHRSRLKADRKMLMPIAVALAHAVQP